MTILRAGFGSRSAAYEIAKSLRFRASANPLLSRTGVAGDPKKVTISAWVKLGRVATDVEQIFEAWSSAGRLSGLGLSNTGLPYFQHIDGTRNIVWEAQNLLRDPSAWLHIAMQMDFTQASSANAVRMFINGTETALNVTVLSGAYAQNMDSYFNTAVSHRHGFYNNTTYADGYRAEIHFLDGILAGPEAFGKTDPVTGQWVPIKYMGAYGTNGHYLDFTDGSSTATLGYDKSGNGRDFTVSGISLTAGVTYDWMDDTPSNNFAVPNPLNKDATLGYTNANLTVTGSGSTWRAGASSFKVEETGVYWEEVVAVVSANNHHYGGISKEGFPLTGFLGSSSLSVGVTYTSGGVAQKYQSGSGSPITGAPANVTINDVWMFAYKNGNLYWGLNGTWYPTGSDPVSESTPLITGLTGEQFPALSLFGTASRHINHGQRPFAYTPPTGFLPLCSKNSPPPAVKKGSRYFDTVLAAGVGIKTACEALYGSFFGWIKDRANANNHQLIDSVRGVTTVLQSNTTVDETTYSAPGGSSVGWVWRIAAGFLDVVTYTGTGVVRTVAHNLGVAPAMVMVKARTTADGSQGWSVYHQSNTAAPATDYLRLNTEDATADLDSVWNDTLPSSSVLTVGTNALVNTSGDDYVAYLFAEVPGYSKFGTYTGNGSANGPFVWCGFKPKFLLVKGSSTSGDWWIYDAERSPANPAVLKLLANTNGVEDVSGEDVDLLSNGFKIRSTAAGQNTNAATYIFAAFAECPFQYATAR